MSQTKLSIIIPVLDEESILPNLLDDIGMCQRNLDFPLECIVVDGGSRDRSVKICEHYDVFIISGPRGRGQQLCAGAQKATGDIFLFLHADSRLTPEHCLMAVETVQANSIIAGSFKLKFDDSHPILRFAEWLNRVRFGVTKIFYGDHGIFLHRDNYILAGGFPKQPLFEDVEFSRRLKKLGQVRMFSPCLLTSARRFKQNGVVLTYFKMAALHVLYWFGVAPEALARWYQLKTRKNEKSRLQYRQS